jgi:hypothetical protein
MYHTCDITHHIARKTRAAAATISKQGIKKQTAHAPAGPSIETT